MGPPDPRWRAFAAAGATLAVLLLAPLAAGTGLGAPATTHEIAYLQQVHGVAPGTLVDLGTQARAELGLGTARLLQVFVMGGITGLLYLAVVLARGRLQALLACLLFAVLPPVAAEGALVRPEAPATLLAGLALLLLQCFAQTARRRPSVAPRRRVVSLLGLGACAALALGLATAELPSLGAQVLLPGLILTLGAAMLSFRAWRLLRRRGWQRLPHRALNARLLPWTAMALATPAVVLAVLALAAVPPGDALRGTPAAASLVPALHESPIAAAITIALLVLGATSAVLRIGLRFGRGGRIGAELVLLVYCALELAATAAAPADADRLPAAPALAIVLAEGLRVLLAALRFVVARRALPGAVRERPSP